MLKFTVTLVHSKKKQISLKGFVDLFKIMGKRNLLSAQGLMQAQRNFQKVNIMTLVTGRVGVMREKSLYRLVR